MGYVGEEEYGVFRDCFCRVTLYNIQIRALNTRYGYGEIVYILLVKL